MNKLEVGDGDGAVASVKPMKIPGRWREGFVLDYHTLGSTYLGDDEYGHPIFETQRTELGELLFLSLGRDDERLNGRSL